MVLRQKNNFTMYRDYTQSFTLVSSSAHNLRFVKLNSYTKCANMFIYHKYSSLPRGILINIAPKVGIFPEAEGRGKYSLPRVQYY